MSIPRPPAALPRPNIAVLRAETLVWTSNRCDPDSAWLFFGDRVRPGDFRIVAARDGRRAPSFLFDVREAGRRAGITIVI